MRTLRSTGQNRTFILMRTSFSLSPSPLSFLLYHLLAPSFPFLHPSVLLYLLLPLYLSPPSPYLLLHLFHSFSTISLLHPFFPYSLLSFSTSSFPYNLLHFLLNFLLHFLSLFDNPFTFFVYSLHTSYVLLHLLLSF